MKNSSNSQRQVRPGLTMEQLKALTALRLAQGSVAKQTPESITVSKYLEERNLAANPNTSFESMSTTIKSESNSRSGGSNSRSGDSRSDARSESSRDSMSSKDRSVSSAQKSSTSGALTIQQLKEMTKLRIEREAARISNPSIDMQYPVLLKPKASAVSSGSVLSSRTTTPDTDLSTEGASITSFQYFPKQHTHTLPNELRSVPNLNNLNPAQRNLGIAYSKNDDHIVSCDNRHPFQQVQQQKHQQNHQVYQLHHLKSPMLQQQYQQQQQQLQQMKIQQQRQQQQRQLYSPFSCSVCIPHLDDLLSPNISLSNCTRIENKEYATLDSSLSTDSLAVPLIVPCSMAPSHMSVDAYAELRDQNMGTRILDELDNSFSDNSRMDEHGVARSLRNRPSVNISCPEPLAEAVPSPPILPNSPRSSTSSPRFSFYSRKSLFRFLESDSDVSDLDASKHSSLDGSRNGRCALDTSRSGRNSLDGSSNGRSLDGSRNGHSAFRTALPPPGFSVPAGFTLLDLPKTSRDPLDQSRHEVF